MRLLSALALVALLSPLPALGAGLPALKGDVTVTGDLVTVGDLFTGAEGLASAPLFRAPRPGTTGTVPLSLIMEMASRAGLTLFDPQGHQSIAIGRAGVAVTSDAVTAALESELRDRGYLPQGARLRAQFVLPEGLSAAAGGETLRLENLALQSGGTGFSARLRLPGQPETAAISGRLDILARAPFLARPVAAGTVLGDGDIEWRDVPWSQVAATGITDISSLIGKALRRNANAGLMLGLGDVTEPLAVRHGGAVRVLYRMGPLTLALDAKAMGDGAVGDFVRVLNPVSNKIVSGTVTAPGEVEVDAAPALQTASLN